MLMISILPLCDLNVFCMSYYDDSKRSITFGNFTSRDTIILVVTFDSRRSITFGNFTSWDTIILVVTFDSRRSITFGNFTSWDTIILVVTFDSRRSITFYLFGYTLIIHQVQLPQFYRHLNVYLNFPYV